MTSAHLLCEDLESPHSGRPGAENMAIDEVLLFAAAQDARTSLRFYRWRPATLSLGYFQHLHDRQLHPASLDCDLVRRASGGGAIVHDQELTYSFALPSPARIGAAEEFYRAFHETLIACLADRNIEAHLHEGAKHANGEPFLCFQRRASNDVVVDGFKVAGSAQRRWKRGMLQHGSVLLEQSPHAPELPGIRELTSINMTAAELAAAWMEKLSSRLNLEFRPSQLTDTEIEHSGQIRQAKFASVNWNAKR